MTARRIAEAYALEPASAVADLVRAVAGPR